MPKTILIVDDEAMVVDIARRKLAKEGYLTIGVYDGEAALNVVQQGAVDLIILDVEMPKMNGIEFLDAYKKISGIDGAPVIVLTANVSMEPVFNRRGVAEYLTKPFRLEDLVDKVRHVLGECDAKR